MVIILIDTFISTDDLWPLEQAYTCCYWNIHYENVTNQLECQQICESRYDCTGICYSYDPELTNNCHECLNDDLYFLDDSYGIYLRPGIVTP